MAQSGPIPRTACAANQTIAASAYGTWLGSSGDPSIVVYGNTVTNIDNAWVNNSEFVAPCRGTYTFSISYVSDASTPCPTDADIGTIDDIWVAFYKAPRGTNPQVIGNPKGALKGQVHTAANRGTASYTLTIPLKTGDIVFTEVASDNNVYRCLASANFEAHKIGR